MGKEFYQARKKAGICTHCSRPAEPGKYQCTTCNISAAKSRAKYFAKPKNRNRRKYTSLQWRIKNKHKAIEAYGGKCNCCGETHPWFLTFHHVNHDGKKHRQAIPGKGTMALVRWLRNNNYPSMIELLCANCHLAVTSKTSCPTGHRNFKASERL